MRMASPCAACRFATCKFPNRKKIFLPPPLPNPGDAPGLSFKSIKKLQVAQNAAARLIAKISMRDPITNVLRELHWLPVTKRCQYKLLVLTYKTLHGTTPTYIHDMLNWYHPARPLRSGAFPSLVPNKHNTITLGRRLCDSATAVLWNNLPRDLRCQQSLQIFKKHLKTHLF